MPFFSVRLSVCFWFERGKNSDTNDNSPLARRAPYPYDSFVRG